MLLKLSIFSVVGSKSQHIPMLWYVVVKNYPFCLSHLRCQSIFELLQSIQPKQAPGQARNQLPVDFLRFTMWKLMVIEE
jgi:hypothetical protein